MKVSFRLEERDAHHAFHPCAGETTQTVMDALRSAAARLKDCVRANQSAAVANVTPHGLHLYLTVCSPIQLGYLTIFKVGSTTISKWFSELCNYRYGPKATLTAGQGQRSTFTQYPNLRNLSFFTFLRNPLDRFPSSVFEAFRRQHVYARAYAKRAHFF